jgi:hypothetical protein
MQCRICLDTSNPEQMLSPCACSGTQAHIHYDCMIQYLRHYPDGICRVCRQNIQYIPRLERFLFLLIMILLTVLWIFTNSPLNMKILFLIAIAALLSTYNVHQFTNLRFSLFLAAINVAFLFIQDAFTNIYMLLVMTLLSTMYTMCLYIHPQHVLTAITIIMVGLYTFIIGFAVLHTTDTYGLSLIITVMFLLWNSWIQTHPPLR